MWPTIIVNVDFVYIIIILIIIIIDIINIIIIVIGVYIHFRIKTLLPISVVRLIKKVLFWSVTSKHSGFQKCFETIS